VIALLAIHFDLKKGTLAVRYSDTHTNRRGGGKKKKKSKDLIPVGGENGKPNCWGLTHPTAIKKSKKK